jgi:hypothetical protein
MKNKIEFYEFDRHTIQDPIHGGIIFGEIERAIEIPGTPYVIGEWGVNQKMGTDLFLMARGGKIIKSVSISFKIVP